MGYIRREEMTMSMQRFTMLLCSCLMCLSLAVQADDMKKEGMMDKTTSSTMDTTGTMDKTMTSGKDAMAKDAMDKGGMTDTTTDMQKDTSDKMHDATDGKMMDKKM
jgi:hypothetical protein